MEYNSASVIQKFTDDKVQTWFELSFDGGSWVIYNKDYEEIIRSPYWTEAYRLFQTYLDNIDLDGEYELYHGETLMITGSRTKKGKTNGV